MAHIQALTTDDILKLKAITLYIVNKCGVADIFHILKILYFADNRATFLPKRLRKFGLIE